MTDTFAAGASGRLIVCATDFSAGAAAALAWAAELARRQGAWLDLVHVVPDAQALIEGVAADANLLEVTRVEQAREELARLARGPVEKGITVRTEVLIGDAAVAIEDHAKRRGARFLVLGASERPTVERWVLGSVAERTVRRATMPVVIVPLRGAQGGEDGEEREEGAGWPTNRPGRALVALEGNEASDLREVLSQLRLSAPWDVTFVHLYWPPAEYARLGLRGPRDLLTPDPEIVRDLEPRLRTLIGALPGVGKVDYRIQPAWGEPAANLALLIEQEPWDLIVVGSHHRHGLARVLSPPVAAHLLRQALRVPIVCVPTTRPAGAAAGLPSAGRITSVLAATDLSPLGNAAATRAYALLRGGGGVVELVHVSEHALPTAAFAYEQPPRLTGAERAVLEEQVRALIPADAVACGITTHVSIIDGGLAAESIVQAAERLHVDVISVGSHGRGGVGRAVLGSVSDEVVRRAHRPVLVVR